MPDITQLQPAHSTPLSRAGRALNAIRLACSLPDGATLTDEQRATLLGFTGWGVLAPAFEKSRTGAWVEIADELEDLLDEASLTAARDQVDTSFFTPRPILSAVFELLDSVGFTGGAVLEPGCGSGRFMAFAPGQWPIRWTGVEIDPTAARMAKLLNPDANIITAPLQKTVFRTGEFDAVIGNVPFSSSTVYDPAFASTSLHGYFLLRALDAVRDGGYVIAITSRYTMDSSGLTSLSREMPEAELMGALRLPSKAFAAAGTEVVTDVLLLRKRAAGEPVRGWDDYTENLPVRSNDYWAQTVSVRPKITEPVDGVSGVAVEVNRYWAEHPEHVAGAMKVSTFYRNPLVVVSEDWKEQLAAAVAAVKPVLIPQTEPRVFDAAAEMADVPLTDADGRKEGSFHLIDGQMFEVADGRLSPVKNNKELVLLLVLRDAACKLLTLESDVNLPDAAIEPARTAALTAYRLYVSKFGALNRGTLSEGKTDPDSGQPTFTWRRPSMGGFRRDPDYVTVMAMEQFNQDDGEASPAPILLRRVNRKPVPVSSAQTAAEALSVSIGEGRGVDLDRIASLLALDGPQEALEALAGLVFRTDGKLVPARDYLSGNVRQKLDAARTKAKVDPAYLPNVAALEKALPAELGALEIHVSLGVPYVETADVNAFASEVLGAYSKVQYTPEVSVWEVIGGTNGNCSADARLAYGTSRVTPLRVLETGLNGRTLTVYDETYANGRVIRVRNITETIAAQEKLRAMNDRFSTWVWEDAERAQRIAAAYNTRFNSHVIRRADGSHLVFPGLAATVTPWAHQRDAVERIVSSERTLIGHPVGAGKTLTMILSAMTLRRLGLANKPLIAVPNHLLDQIVREAQQAFPTGKFLIASKEDLVGSRRRLFAARCATGDWDAVVMTHSVFGSLPVSPDIERDWIQEQKADLRSALSAASESVTGTHGKGAKAIARSIRALEARLAGLRDGLADDKQVLFDHLGVDYLMVDEAHLYRRLATGSTSRDNGFGSGSSKRATDLLLKIETLAQTHPGKPIVSLFTGTPWANTLAETWVWQRYLQPDALEAAGVKMFEPWVSAFVKYENAVEVSPDGSGFRMQKRPVGMRNLPELKTMLGQVSDIVSAEQIGLERPEHTVHNVVADPTAEQLEYVKGLAERAEDIHDGHGKREDGSDDSMLLVCNDGRKVALDPILVGIEERSAKLHEAAATIAGVYEQTKDLRYGESQNPGAFQLALLDLGTPHPGDAAVYGRLRSMLVARGVPAEKIRFVHEAKTDKARAHLFAQAREGAISVLLGSTSKVGIGTNIQTRLAALHHIDPPWTPAEVEQREGRGLRPGNLNPHIDIYRYVTEHTFDAYVWQALERKAKSFAALYDSSSTVREVDDVSSVALSFGEIKALAAGNPLLLSQATLASAVQRLRLMRSVHLQGVNRARDLAKRCRQRAKALTQSREAIEKVLDAGIALDDEVFPGPVDDLAASIASKQLKSWTRYQYRQLSLKVSSGTSAVKDELSIEFYFDYDKLGSVKLTKSDIRRGGQEIAEKITGEVDAWLDEAPKVAAHQRTTAAALLREAEDNERSAQTAAFDGEEELADKQRQLDEIDRLILDEAGNKVPAAA